MTEMAELRNEHWFAAYVRSRHEINVATHLANRNVEFFLPQYKAKRQWSDRTVQLTLPLFPGYIFVRIQRDERVRVLETPGVLYLVGGSGRPEPLDDSEIENLKNATHKGNDPRPHVYLHEGDRVMVVRGPLQGSEGLLIREKNKNRVVLSMVLINSAMSVEVDADAIVPIGKQSDAFHISISQQSK